MDVTPREEAYLDRLSAISVRLVVVLLVARVAKV